MKTPVTTYSDREAHSFLRLALDSQNGPPYTPDDRGVVLVDTTKGLVWTISSQERGDVQAHAWDKSPLHPVVTHHGQGRHNFWGDCKVKRSWRFRSDGRVERLV